MGLFAALTRQKNDPGAGLLIFGRPGPGGGLARPPVALLAVDPRVDPTAGTPEDRPPVALLALDPRVDPTAGTPEDRPPAAVLAVDPRVDPTAGTPEDRPPAALLAVDPTAGTPEDRAPVALFAVDPTAGTPAGFGLDAAETLTLPPAAGADLNGSTLGVALLTVDPTAGTPGSGVLGRAVVALLAVDPTADTPAGFGLDAAETLTLPPAAGAALKGSTYGVAGVFDRALGVDATFAAPAGGAGRPFTFDDADGSAVFVYPFACLGTDEGAGFLSRALMGCFPTGPF